MPTGYVEIDGNYNTTGVVNRLTETFKNFGLNPQYIYAGKNYDEGVIIDWKERKELAMVGAPTSENRRYISISAENRKKALKRMQFFVELCKNKCEVHSMNLGFSKPENLGFSAQKNAKEYQENLKRFNELRKTLMQDDF